MPLPELLLFLTIEALRVLWPVYAFLLSLIAIGLAWQYFEREE